MIAQIELEENTDDDEQQQPDHKEYKEDEGLS